MVSLERHAEAMEKINSLISVRERSCHEVRSRLTRCGFEAEEVDDAIASAIRCGLIDEERFTRAFIRGKSHLGWGRGKIMQRLQMEQIDDETIEACSDEFAGPEEEFERALLELQKRPSRSKDPYVSYMRRLVGKGYSYDVAHRAAKECLEMQSG